jgi:hypothetical protein
LICWADYLWCWELDWWIIACRPLVSLTHLAFIPHMVLVSSPLWTDGSLVFPPMTYPAVCGALCCETSSCCLGPWPDLNILILYPGLTKRPASIHHVNSNLVGDVLRYTIGETEHHASFENSSLI